MPIDFVRVTCFNNAHFEEFFFNMCGSQHILTVSTQPAIRKDIRPFETFTFRSPTRNKHNHCSPQRHTILLLHFPLFSWPRHLQCAEQQVSRSNRTKYCACHAERLTYLVLISNETSFTLRGTTGVTIQPHHILRLSRKKTHILSPHHI